MRRFITELMVELKLEGNLIRERISCKATKRRERLDKENTESNRTHTRPSFWICSTGNDLLG